MSFTAGVMIRVGMTITNVDEKLQAVSKSFDDAARGWSNVGQRLSVAVTLPLMAIAGVSTKIAADFRTGLGEVSTLVSDAGSQMGELEDAAKRLGIQYGEMPTDQVGAIYEIISAGASDAASAIMLLEESNRLAVGGKTDVKTAADGLTSTLNAYGYAADQAGKVSDQFFVAMRAGKTRIAELAASIGSVAPLAAQAGASLEEVLASTAALTKGGVSTSTAMNGVRAILAAVVKPTDEASGMAEQLGLRFDAAALKSQGFAGFLEEVQKKTKGNTAQLSLLFGGVEALTPVLALTGAAAADFGSILEDMGDSAGQTEAAVAKMMETPGRKAMIAKAQLQVAAITIGDAILPIVTPIAAALGRIAQKFAELGRPAQVAVMAIAGIVAAAGPVMIAIGMIGSALAALTTTFTLASGATVTFGSVLAAAFWPVTLALAAIAAGIYVWSRWGDQIKAAVRPVIDVLLAFGQKAVAVAGLVLTAALFPLIKAWTQFRDTVLPALRSFGAGALRTFREVRAGVRENMDRIADSVSRGWANAMQAFRSTDAGRAIMGVWDRIAAVVRSWGPRLLQMGRDWVKAIVDGLLDALRQLPGGGTVADWIARQIAPGSVSAAVAARAAAAGTPAGAAAAAAPPDVTPSPAAPPPGTSTEKGAAKKTATERQAEEVRRLSTAMGQLTGSTREYFALQERAAPLLERVERQLAAERDLASERANELRDEAQQLRRAMSVPIAVVPPAPPARLGGALPREMAMPAEFRAAAGYVGKALVAPTQAARSEDAQAAWSRAVDGITAKAAELRAGFADVRNQFTEWGQTSEQMGQMVRGALLGVAQQFTPLGIAAEFIGYVLEGMQPALDALKVPLRIVGNILGAAIAPVLRVLFPLFKGLGIAATFIGEIFFRVAGGIAKAIGSLIYALGAAIDRIPGLGDFGLKRVGEGIKDFGRGMTDSADEMKRGRKELQDLSWEDALEGVGETAQRVSEQLTNVPTIINLALLRYRASTSGRTAPAAGASPAAAGRVAAVEVSPTYNINVTAGSAAEARSIGAQIRDALKGEGAELTRTVVGELKRRLPSYDADALALRSALATIPT